MIETYIFGSLISALLGVGVRALFALTREIGELKTEFRSHRIAVIEKLEDHETRIRARELHD